MLLVAAVWCTIGLLLLGVHLRINPQLRDAFLTA